MGGARAPPKSFFSVSLFLCGEPYSAAGTGTFGSPANDIASSCWL